MTFDLAEHADAIEEMRAVQAEIDAEALEGAADYVDALALLDVARQVQATRASELEHAHQRLEFALRAVLAARESLEEAIALTSLAGETVLVHRGHHPEHVRTMMLDVAGGGE